MLQVANMTIREIALEAPLTTRVFEEFKIDYCCGGRVPFAEACEQAGIDPKILSGRLEQIMAESAGNTEFAEFSSQSDLVDHIVSKHHVFTRDEIARLTPLADKVCGKHGEHFPELLEIRDNFRKLGDELLFHMQKEEQVLFPYIKELEVAAEQNKPVNIPHFGTVQNPVRMMMFEHDAAGDILKAMRRLSNDYTTPPDSCPSFKGLYAGLEDLEKDLHRHIHLENNVLFPKAIAAETDIVMKEGAGSSAPCLAHALL
jgi:regulator of cell morphogenesis and NO signaling